MTRQTSTHFALSLAVLGLMLSISPIPGATGTWANGINNNCIIVGDCADGVCGYNGGNGFLATPQ
jgi:hypothetical protein